MPGLYPENPVVCDPEQGGCGAHFVLSPGHATDGLACPECGGKRLFRDQPSPTQSDGTLRDMVDSASQKDNGGNPLGEGSIMGSPGNGTATQPAWRRDEGTYGGFRTAEYPSMQYEYSDIPESMSLQQWRQQPQHNACPLCNEPVDDFSSHAQAFHPELWAGNRQAAVRQKVEMLRELNMEPYMPWTHEASVHTAGPLALDAPFIPEEAAGAAAAGGAIGDAAGAAGSTVGDLASGGWNALKGGIGGLFGGGAGGMAKKLAPTLLKGALKAGEGMIGGGGQQAGGMSAEPVTPAPSMISYGSTDIPFLLVADLETPHSIKSIDEQEDDPQDQDQKEFEDGDDSPSNHKNPNNEDSGSDGEDGVREDTPGYGFGENSPGLERMMMILPLLLHYFESPESGLQDPIIKAIHETLEQENPGYLDQEDPEGHGMVQMVIQHHKSPHGVHAGVGFPSGLPPVPMPGGAGGTGAVPNASGTCPECGGPMVNGQCPTCGGGYGQQQMQPGAAGGTASLPPMMANHVGPVTPEQVAAIAQLLISQGRDGEIEIMKQNPQLYAKELQEIQQNPQPAPPLVDPSQSQPPAPMEQAPGGMPMPGMGAGDAGGMPMQPMSRFESHIFEATQELPTSLVPGATDEAREFGKQADANNLVPRCPKCKTATTSLISGADNDPTTMFGKCHNPGCLNVWKLEQPKESRQVWAEIPNPTTLPAADQHSPIDLEHSHSPGMVWKDNGGNELQAGATYELHSPAFPAPDVIRVVDASKPDAITVELVGQHDNLNGGGIPFELTRQEAQLEHYTFLPYQGDQADMDGRNTEPPTGTPGLEQVPPSGPTTDEHQDSYPNTAVSHVEDDGTCMKCGSVDVHSEMSSPATTMHQCYRCDHAWESNEDDEGRTAGVDLSWLREDSSPLDFTSERALAMERASSGSRNIGDIAAQDERLQRIKSHLEAQPKFTDRMAGRQFTHGERRELIDETGRARNLGDLDLSNTHYDTRLDFTGKANGENAPDEHLVFGL